MTNNRTKYWTQRITQDNTKNIKHGYIYKQHGIAGGGGGVEVQHRFYANDKTLNRTKCLTLLTTILNPNNIVRHIYKQLVVKTNQTSFLYGNRNGYDDTEHRT